ncbi:DUF2931 family protein [Lysobacter sp. CW239]|uniref:DUF2931 family protein n=1 Tax=Lysobacteraceae TaxID=32033 RepID=UPI0009FC4A02|nr:MULTISPECIES: DUF2931 family protein [Lysobacter]QOD91354.1 DUF2931 family protein [Lysobacter sp. CW239]
MKRWLLLLTALLLAGCATGSMGAIKAPLPYDAWYLGFSAPPYMEVWVETADVEDMTGRIFTRAGSGTVSIGYAGDPAQWQAPRSMGAGKYVAGADLPRRIYVRWQSLVEPQTYRVILEIPESARELMRTKTESRAIPGKWDYQNVVAIGLLPGGAIKVMVRSPGGLPIEVLCQQAEVEPKGPSQGLTGGRYAYSFEKLELKTQQYLKTRAIPYDSWKCPGRP